MTQVRLTVEQASNYVKDPRNDRGPFTVMGWAVTSDCPERHDDQNIIESDEGFWSNELGWTIEADATVFTDAEMAAFSLPIGDNVRWLEYACRCWDGVTEDELDEVTGLLDESSGPFELWYEGDEMPMPRVWTLLDLIGDLASYAEACYGQDDFITWYRKERLEAAVTEALDYAQAIAGGGVLMKPEDISWGECPDREPEKEGGEHPHLVALNMCEFCLQYDPD